MTDSKKSKNNSINGGKFYHGIQTFKNENGMGWVDVDGIVLMDNLERCSDFISGVGRYTKKDGRCGWMKRTGSIIVEGNFIRTEDFVDGIAYFKETDGNAGYINLKGEVIADGFVDGENFCGGFAVVAKKVNNGLLSKDKKVKSWINTNGEIISKRFEDAFNFKNGKGSFMNENGTFGYVNETGEVQEDNLEKSID